VPVAYYFKNEYPNDDVDDILNHVEEYCKDNEIQYNVNEGSFFQEE
jgi:hypothetical protein